MSDWLEAEADLKAFRDCKYIYKDKATYNVLVPEGLWNRTLHRLEAALAEPSEGEAPKVERRVLIVHAGPRVELDTDWDDPYAESFVIPEGDTVYAERPVPVPRPKSREEELADEVRKWLQTGGSDWSQVYTVVPIMEKVERMLREIGAKKGGQ